MLLLTRLRFSGFRSYPGNLSGLHSNMLPLRALTLLIGRNNAGKSQVLRLLHQLLAGLSQATGLLLTGQSDDRVFSRSLEDNFHFRSPAHPLFIQLSWELDGVAGSLDITFAGPSPLDPEPSITVLSWQLAQGDQHQEGTDQVLPWEAEPWSTVRAALCELWRDSIALSGNRASIQRTYPIPQGSRAPLGQRGERSAEWLFRSPELLARVRGWLRENLPPIRVEIDTSGGELRLIDGAGDSQLNLAEAAEGIHQLLPIATLLCARAMEKNIFVDTVEQPELHLHDAMHGALGDLLLDAAGLHSGAKYRDQGRRIVVETHSEGLLLRIRRRIAEGKISAEHIGLAFVDRDDRGSRLREIKLSANGEPEWWPDNFFLERLREVQAISVAIRNRSNADAV